MVLASSSGLEHARQGRRCCRRARRARRGAAVEAPAPPDPQGARWPSCGPSLHAQSCIQKRVGHPATAAIGSRPGGFKKNGTTAHPHPPLCDPRPGIGPTFTTTTTPQAQGSASSLCGRTAATAEPAPLRTLRGEGAGRVGCVYRCGEGQDGGHAGMLGSPSSCKGGEGGAISAPSPPSQTPLRPNTNLVVDVLQGFLARGPPDLHLPAGFNRWLPTRAPALPGVRWLRVGAQVGDVPLLGHHLPRAPAHRQ